MLNSVQMSNYCSYIIGLQIILLEGSEPKIWWLLPSLLWSCLTNKPSQVSFSLTKCQQRQQVYRLTGWMADCLTNWLPDWLTPTWPGNKHTICISCSSRRQTDKETDWVSQQQVNSSQSALRGWAGEGKRKERGEWREETGERREQTGDRRQEETTSPEP